MKRRILWLVFLASVLVTSSRTAEAATINAPSCSRTDVGNAVASVTNGDTVSIPAGDCTWASQLNIAVGITLSGGGQGFTIIRDNVTKNGSQSSSLMSFNVAAPNKFRLTGITMVGVAPDPNIFNKGHIAIGGSSKAFRIDHVTVTTPQTSFIRADGDLWGVIDHITIENLLLLQAGHSNWGGSNYGDGSWAEQLYLGTERAIYIEDCVMTANGNPFTTNFLDGLDGARVVFRHNILTQGNTTSHGVDSGQRRRSIRSQEIYSNTFTFPAGMAADFIAWFRGGTGVMFNNIVNIPGGLNAVAKHDNLRDTGSYNPWGKCDGTSVFDENEVGQTGYRCVDQAGSGTSNNLAGIDPPPAQWVGSILDPIYVWNNTVNGVADNCGTFGCGTAGHVQVGRDIILGTARPGYTPFTYPHPLVTGTGGVPASAPTDLQIK